MPTNDGVPASVRARETQQMPSSDITQTEADALMALEKVRTGDEVCYYLFQGESVRVPLASSDGREQFTLDVSRGHIEMLRVKHQTRARQVIILVRLDLGGPPHHNPDGQEVACPHLHVYREGYGDKWAVAVPPDRFPDVGDLWQTLHDFMSYCNVTRPPLFQKRLFV